MHISLATGITKFEFQKWGYRDGWEKSAEIFCAASGQITISTTSPPNPTLSTLFTANLPKGWLPSSWNLEYSACNSYSQSPINIRYKFSKYRRTYKKIVITTTQKGSDSQEKWKIDNIDHTLVITPLDLSTTSTPAPLFEYTFELKPDGETYKLKRIVFRWPTSEHLYNSKRYDIEAQLEFEMGSQKAIIAIFFKLSDTDNPDLAIITDRIKDIITEGPRPIPIAANQLIFRFSQIFPTEIKKYFRYSGSLTYPPCDQNVKWIVAKSPVRKVSQKQIQLFQDLKFRYIDYFNSDNSPTPAYTLDEPLKHYCQFNILTNVRPVQRRNERKVYRSFKNKPRKREGEGEGEA